MYRCRSGNKKRKARGIALTPPPPPLSPLPVPGLISHRVAELVLLNILVVEIHQGKGNRMIQGMLLMMSNMVSVQ
jgi:hypothetical protein